MRMRGREEVWFLTGLTREWGWGVERMRDKFLGPVECENPRGSI